MNYSGEVSIFVFEINRQCHLLQKAKELAVAGWIIESQQIECGQQTQRSSRRVGQACLCQNEPSRAPVSDSHLVLPWQHEKLRANWSGARNRIRKCLLCLNKR